MHQKDYLIAVVFLLTVGGGILFLSEISTNKKNIQNNLAAQVFETPTPSPAASITPTPNSAPEFSAHAVYSIFFDRTTEESKILLDINGEKPLPIASISKLMTALVVLKHYNLDAPVVISEKAIQEPEDSGNFKTGEVFTVQGLLYSLLVESSNDAAAALAEVVGRDHFVQLMNENAKELGLSSMQFSNPTGLDPKTSAEKLNTSSSSDLALLTRYLLVNFPSIFDMLSIEKFTLLTAESKPHHIMSNTNKLLGHDGWPTKILGGKTGMTPTAQGTLLLVLESPDRKGYIVNIMLNTPHRFQEMEELTDWILATYK
ncbi:MAG: D-alanyl-D-alanine carboxypeptidase [Candidatus Wildermuthbacteria bacterium]|nr:D-alanyl-D-alanine carboxypeptidase [Candidatus Wildermuthbacteria bacterium]